MIETAYQLAGIIQSVIRGRELFMLLILFDGVWKVYIYII